MMRLELYIVFCRLSFSAR